MTSHALDVSDPDVSGERPTHRAEAGRRARALTALLGFREIVLIAGVYSLYDVTRYVVKGHQAAAFSHALQLVHFESRLDIDPEHWLNHAVSPHLWIALPSDYFYAVLHYVVTPAVLIWLWRRHSSAYSHARSILIVATLIGLVGFSLLPVAPPRLLPSLGFIDTMAHYAHYGWWSNAASAPRGFGVDTNQFAAFPSLHVGWAVWCGWQLARFGKHRVTQVLGIAYPIVLGFVVIATGNHYLVDVLAGVAVVGVAALLVRLIEATHWHIRPRRPAAAPLSP